MNFSAEYFNKGFKKKNSEADTYLAKGPKNHPEAKFSKVLSIFANVCLQKISVSYYYCRRYTITYHILLMVQNVEKLME